MHQFDHYEFFCQPKILSGLKAMENIPVELDSYGSSRPMIITGGTGNNKTHPCKLRCALRESNLTVGALVDDIPGYASMRQSMHLAALFLERKCDSIIALGGGAVMETARTVNILSRNRDMKKALATAVPGPLNPLVYVYAGDCDGLETSCRVHLDYTGMESPFLYPDVICIDDRLVKLPCGDMMLDRGLAALTRSVEASCDPHTNPMTEAYASAAIRFIRENLETAVKKPCRKAPALAIANATVFGGIAHGMSPDGIAGILGQVLSCLTGKPAGILMAVILPRVIEYRFNREGKDRVGSSLLLNLGGQDNFATVPEKERPAAAVQALAEYVSGLPVPRSLEEAGITADVLEQIKAIGPSRIEGAKKSAIDIILDHAWKGTPVTKGGAR